MLNLKPIYCHLSLLIHVILASTANLPTNTKSTAQSAGVWHLHNSHELTLCGLAHVIACIDQAAYISCAYEIL